MIAYPVGHMLGARSKRESEYKATGCNFHNDCLTCPFPECLKENAELRKQIIKERKNADR